MNKLKTVGFYLIAAFMIGCTGEPKNLTPIMKANATKTVQSYLNAHNLPAEGLSVSVSENRDIADYSFMYTGGGRCINFIVTCYDERCLDLQKYPYDEHSEDCPVKRNNGK